jgi:hypothetical protein
MLYSSAACVRDLLIDGSQVIVLPEGEFAAVVPPHHEAFHVPEIYVTDDPLLVPLRPGEDPYIIYRHDAPPAWNGPTLVEVDPVTFQNGVSFTGYFLEENSMYLRWHLPETWEKPDVNSGFLQYFVHFLDSEGNRIGQRDAQFYIEGYWCGNDTIITWVPVDIPADFETLRVGMYYLNEGRTDDLNVVDDNGTALGTWADFDYEQP